MENQPQFPAEEVTLPSKGLLYSDDSPLKKGIIEMKYMTAREEDILTNPNFIKIFDEYKFLFRSRLYPINYIICLTFLNN